MVMPGTVSVEDIQRLHWRLLGVAAVLAAVTSVLSPWSVLLGGTVMGANVWLLRRLLQHLVARPRRRTGPVIALGLLKQLVFLGLLGVLFSRAGIDAPAFALGVSLLTVASVVTVVYAQRRGGRV